MPWLKPWGHVKTVSDAQWITLKLVKIALEHNFLEMEFHYLTRICLERNCLQYSVKRNKK